MTDRSLPKPDVELARPHPLSIALQDDDEEFESFPLKGQVKADEKSSPAEPACAGERQFFGILDMRLDEDIFA